MFALVPLSDREGLFLEVLYIVLRNLSKQTRVWKLHFKSHLKPPSRVSNSKGHSEGRCGWFEKSMFIRMAIYLPLLSSWCEWNSSRSILLLCFAGEIQLSLYNGQQVFPPAPSMDIPTSNVLVQKMLIDTLSAGKSKLTPLFPPSNTRRNREKEKLQI